MALLGIIKGVLKVRDHELRLLPIQGTFFIPLHNYPAIHIQEWNRRQVEFIQVLGFTEDPQRGLYRGSLQSKKLRILRKVITMMVNEILAGK